MDNGKDFYLQTLERHSKENSATGFVARKLFDWLTANPERLIHREEALDVFYNYYWNMNNNGLDLFLFFVMKHNVPGVTRDEIAECINNDIATPWNMLVEKEEIKFESRKLATKKQLGVDETPVDERKSAIVARLRRKLERRKK